jgi:hypothetical protein
MPIGSDSPRSFRAMPINEPGRIAISQPAREQKEPFLYQQAEHWMQPIIDFTSWLVRSGLAGHSIGQTRARTVTQSHIASQLRAPRFSTRPKTIRSSLGLSSASDAVLACPTKCPRT